MADVSDPALVEAIRRVRDDNDPTNWLAQFKIIFLAFAETVM